jgi:hypothetical protein
MIGQVFVRETGVEKNGKKLYIVAGIVGLDENDMLLSGETQYTITKMNLQDPVDRTLEGKGQMIDGLLRSLIWRV